jgi:multimeric flavodoxin WrbA
MFLCGSPRKEGNTNRVVKWVADTARDAGAEVEIVDVARIDFKSFGCNGCMACQQREEFGCVIDDEATAVINRMPEVDILVLATPIYAMGPTAQLKIVIDRMFSLLKFDTYPPRAAMKGVEYALIATAAGRMQDGLGLVDEMFRTSARFMHFPYESLLVPFAPWNPENMDKNEGVKKKAIAFGRSLAGVD